MKASLNVRLYFIAMTCLMVFASCEKCYVCTCTNATTNGASLDTCSTPGQQIEMCDRGIFGKTTLTARMMEKESQGYTCSMK